MVAQGTFAGALLSTSSRSFHYDFERNLASPPKRLGSLLPGSLAPTKLFNFCGQRFWQMLAFAHGGSYIDNRASSCAVGLFALRRPRAIFTLGPIAGPGDRLGVRRLAAHCRPPDTRPTWFWHAHGTRAAAVLVSGTHRPAVPCLRDDDELRLFRARTSAEQSLCAADGHTAGGADVLCGMGWSVHRTDGQTDLSLALGHSQPILRSAADVMGGRRLGVEDFHPRARDRRLLTR
jgi:hypothetical protein